MEQSEHLQHQLGVLLRISLSAVVCSTVLLCQEAHSGDAYVHYDQKSNTWSLGTSRVEEKLRFAHNAYSEVSLEDKPAHIQYTVATQAAEAFRISAEGQAYTGLAGKWVLKGSSATVPSEGQIQLVITLENHTFRVEQTYVVYASTSIIRQWVRYRNISTEPVSVSDPYFLAHRFGARGVGGLTLQYMTGGGYFTGSQILKDVPLSSTFSRTFDSMDKPERIELDDVSYGYPLPWGSGAYMQWFCINGASSGGVFVWFDYYGRWAADIGNFYGGPGYLGLRVAGFKKTLAPGEDVLTHKAFTGVYVGDLDAMGNDLKDWQYRYLWSYKNKEYFAKTRYATEMRWQYDKGNVAVGGGTEDNWDYRTASLFHSIDVMRSVGADVLWQDAGWHDHLGDNDGPDFAAVQRYLKKSGMNLAIWWPLYSVSSASRVYREHPDWVSDRSNPEGSNLDTSKKAVIDYLLHQLDTKVSLWGDFQWRLDGTAVEPVNKDEAPMLSEYHNVMQLLAEFRERHPQSSIDICSGGGNLMGFETLRMSDVSQLTDAGSLYIANYYSSYLFPPDVIDDWTRDDDFTWEHARSALTMAPAWMSDRGLYGFEPGLLLNHGEENLRRTFETYRYLVQKGVAGRWTRVYHPAVQGDDPVYYFERLSRDAQRGVLILKRFAQGDVHIWPKGLNALERYDVRFARSRKVEARTGADLMKSGIHLTSPEPGELIYLGLPDHPGSGTDRIPPSDPTHVIKSIGSNMGITGVELQWNASTDNNWLSHYLIYRDGVPIDTVSKGTYFFDHSDGPTNISARYQVQAVDGDGNASQSVEAVNITGNAVLYTAQGGYLSGKDYSYQGANHWSYEEWVGSSHTPMTWDGALGQMGLYRGLVGPGHNKPEIGASWMQPGDAADAVRVFSLPYTGEVTVRSRPHKDIYHTYGDGVRLKVLKNDAQIWPASGWQTIAAKDVLGTNVEVKTSVRRGDKLYFVANRNSDPTDDETVWNPQIAYSRIEDALVRTPRTATNDDSSRLDYEGTGWQKQGLNPWASDVDQGYLPGWSNGSLSVSGTAGDTLTVKFRGTGIEIIGQTGSDRGIARIALDGHQAVKIDTFSPQQIVRLTLAQRQIRQAAQWQTSPATVLWGTRNLSKGEHLLELTVTGQKNENSSGTYIGVDSIVVYDGWTLTASKK